MVTTRATKVWSFEEYFCQFTAHVYGACHGCRLTLRSCDHKSFILKFGLLFYFTLLALHMTVKLKLFGSYAWLQYACLAGLGEVGRCRLCAADITPINIHLTAYQPPVKQISFEYPCEYPHAPSNLTAYQIYPHCPQYISTHPAPTSDTHASSHRAS